MQNLREWTLSEWVDASGAQKDVEVINIAEQCNFTPTKWSSSQFSEWKHGRNGNAPGIKDRETALEMIKTLRECARRNLSRLFSNELIVTQSTAFLCSNACRHQFAPLTPDELIDICQRPPTAFSSFKEQGEQINAIYHHIQPAPPHQLFGRKDELLEGLRELSQHEMCAIDGMGGDGKTALAFHIALKSLQNNLVHKVAWVTDKRYFIDVDGKVVSINNDNHDDFLIKICKTMAKTFNWISVLSSEGDKIISGCADMLRKERCLVVVDNLETLKSAQEIVERLGTMLIPHGIHEPLSSRVLFTSRTEVISQNCQRIPLSGIEMDDRIAYLQHLQQVRSASRPLTDQETYAIAEASAGNPLLLQFSIERYIVEPHPNTVEVLVDSLTRGNAQIMKHIFKPLLSEHLPEDVGAYAKKLAIEYTYAKDTLSTNVLRDLWSEHGADNEDAYIGAIKMLTRSRILSWSGDQLTMHPLIRSYLLHLSQ
ncbi:MAG: NB-ARC domain-containing protein [Anaerolineae bacterium]